MSWRIWAASAATLAAWGCGPPEIIPVAPPGMAYEQVQPEVSEEDAAQALGESRTALTPRIMPPADPTPPGEPRTTASGLTYETLQPGDGPAVRSGQSLSLHYTGTLEDGSVFDSSRDRGIPFTFRLGSGSVIAGWDEGVTGMKVGERRKLTIPPALGYGSNSPSPKIPPNSTLIFDVELLEIQ